MARASTPWLPWLIPAAVVAFDLATPHYKVVGGAYVIPCALAATITTSMLVERAAERRVPRQLRQLTAHLDELAKQAPIAEVTRLTWQAAAEAFGAKDGHLPRAVGSSLEDDPTVIIPTGRKLWLLPPTKGKHGC